MTDNAAMFDEIMRWSDIRPARQDGDFTVSEFAAHIGRSEATAKRVLKSLAEGGSLGTEKRFDAALRRNCRVYWVAEKGGTPIGSSVGVWGEGRESE